MVVERNHEETACYHLLREKCWPPTHSPYRLMCERILVALVFIGILAILSELLMLFLFGTRH